VHADHPLNALGVEEYAEIYRKVVEGMEVQYRRAELIHGDLSEYNIMCGPDLSVYFIDLSQAVLIHHPRADFYLMRDIRNVNRYFASKGVKVLEDEEFFRGILMRFLSLLLPSCFCLLYLLSIIALKLAQRLRSPERVDLYTMFQQ
jgi:serine/threonine-protein kinase RIO1